MGKVSFRRRLMQSMGFRKIESAAVEAPFEAQSKLLAHRDVQTIFDVGANIGQTARRSRRWFKNAKIWSFEPLPDTYAELEATHAGDRKVETRKEAVGAEVGRAVFHVNAKNYNHSLLGAASGGDQWAAIDHVGEIEVPVTTVDAFCAEQGIQTLDILKTDAEGADLLALRGAKTMLSEHRIGLVFCEVLFKEIFEGQASFNELMDYLEPHGYGLHDLYGHHHGEDGRLIMANALFVGPRVSGKPA